MSRLAVLPLAVLLLAAPRRQGPALVPECAAGNVTVCVQTAGTLLRSGTTALDSARAVAHQLKACELNHAGSCNDYGYALVMGIGLPRNPDASAPYYLKGCELGSPVACRNYGYNLLKGQFGLQSDPKKSSNYLRISCEADYQVACVDLGIAERGGLDGKTPQDGLTRLVNACNRNSALGCYQAGIQLRDSLGVPADLNASVSYFKRACEQPGTADADHFNGGEGCSSLAYAYEYGRGVAANPARAASVYRRGCDFGSAYSCTGLGLLKLGTRLGPPDSTAAVELFAQACGMRQAAGCGNQGKLVARGWGGHPAVPALGRRLLDQGCQDGFMGSCRWLAEVMIDGVGAAADTAGGLALYQRACDRHDQDACVSLGLAYAGGNGVPRDERKAIGLYQVACQAGNSFGCNNLGVLLRAGPLELQNISRANQLFEQECARENYRACANLGYDYEFGRGVRLDEARALELYRKSCGQQDAYGCSQLRRLAPDSAAVAAPRGGPPARGLWALVVGLSKYQSKEIRPLSYARKDAEAFAEFLMSANGGGFPPEHVQLLVDEQATADALRRGLHSFLRKANQDDLVIIYFAGHGRQTGNELGVPYFLTYETDPREMAVTAVPMDELRRAVQQSITARYIVAFIDACHSGGVTLATRGSAENDLINRYLAELSKSKETVVTLAASQENQESLEGPEYGGGHGAFTWNLIQGLKGAADKLSEGGDESGTVTLKEIASYVTRKVKDATGNLQEPSLSYLKWDPGLVLSVLRAR